MELKKKKKEYEVVFDEAVFEDRHCIVMDKTSVLHTNKIQVLQLTCLISM